MISLLYGIAAVALVWWLSQLYARANPRAVARALKIIGGVAALGGAAVMLFRGRIDMALLLGGVAAWLLGWSRFSLPRFGGRTAPSPGRISRVRSALVEMILDHDTGEMSGEVLAGPFAGRPLDSLAQQDLALLLRECLVSDPDGARLLEAYLDRRFAGWREHAERDGDAGARTQPHPSTMSEQEAYEILGLQPGAGADDIRHAHRMLMKKLHPDQGGSTYLAARVNAAKEILLSRHR